MKVRVLCGIFIGSIAFLWGCKVTSQDIETWKGTQKGPEKLTAVLLDKRYPPGLRAEAACALAEIGQWDKHDKALEAIEDASRSKIIDNLAPLLIEKIKEGNEPPSPPTATQVAAKDSLFVILQYADDNMKAQIEDTLVEWCVADFNHRFFSGRYSIEVTLMEVGERATDGLVNVLKPDFLAYDKVTEILVKVGSKNTNEKAGSRLVEIARSRNGKVEEALLVSLGRMGGKDVREFLLELSVSLNVPSRVQRGALMSYLQFKLCHKDDVEKLFKIAEDEAQDTIARNFAYDAVVCAGDKTQVPRLYKLLHETGAKKDNYRGVGVDEILKLGGPERISDIVREIAAEKDPWNKFENLRDFVMVRFTQNNDGKPLCEKDRAKVLEQIRPLVSSKEVLARAITIFTLGLIGEPSDINTIKKYLNDGGKLNEWKSKEGEIIGAGGKIQRVEAMDFRKVGDVAKWAINSIKKKG